MARKQGKNRPPDARAAKRRELPAAASADARLWTAGGALFALALTSAVFLAYQPAWHGLFLWDDNLTLLNNPVLRPGGLWRTWVPGSYLNYWPLTFSVYRLEYALWGLDPTGFHLVNIGLHAATAILLWRVLVELEVPGAMAAAAVFALHPVNVESVAWIAQLKNTLSLFLGMLAALLYLRYDRRGERWRYAAAIAAFALSALAKGMMITLPVVLLACVWWRRRSLAWRDAARLAPFLPIAALMTGIEVWTQHMVGSGLAVRSDSLASRAAVAGCAVWFYLGKVLWPFNLCFVYPRWKIDAASFISYLPGAMLVCALALGIWWRRTWGAALVASLVCYVALLLPALGFTNIYFMRYSLVSDHWQYAAAIVPCAVFSGVVADWTRRGRGAFRRKIAAALCLALLAGLAALTWRQSRLYADAQTLYEATIARNPDCWIAYNNLGQLLAPEDKKAAIALYRKALAIRPDYAEPHVNLGKTFLESGQTDDAIAEFNAALKIDPGNAEANNNMGMILAGGGQLDKAIAYFRKALEAAPYSADIHCNLGKAFFARGQYDEAIAEFQRSLYADPDSFDTHFNLGSTLAASGRYGQAVTEFRKALQIQPDSHVAQDYLRRAQSFLMGDAGGREPPP